MSRLRLFEAIGVEIEYMIVDAESLDVSPVCDRLIEKMARALGFPSHDPHGAPIPARDGTLVRKDTRPLLQVGVGESVVVVEVDDRNPAVLRYLAERRMFPGTGLNVLRVEPFGGSIVVRVDQDEFTIGPDAAADVRVAP